MTLYSTFDTNSTEGDYYGDIYFSFSSTNSSDYSYSSFLGPGDGDLWSGTSTNQIFTEPVTGAQISISLQASGFSTRGGELDFISVMTVNDPTLGTLNGGLGNGYQGSSPYNV
jgi:hypothetical protein